MSVLLSSNSSEYDRASCGRTNCAHSSDDCIDRSTKSLTVGLVNNMPDGALQSTERQFRILLESASRGLNVRLRLYALPGVPRGEAAARHIGRHYASTEQLGATRLDGLIVTGREPLTPSLCDEPYWNSFTKLLGWAQANTTSTVWSCLAAHAAVLHMDGIGRVRSDHKHCGVLECARISEHLLTADIPSCFAIPHSRWNGLVEEELMERGYQVLTRTAGAGVDTFIRQTRSLFMFFQGHPEYESNTLLLEYRRDVARFFRGETKTYPTLPQSYFAPETMLMLRALEEEAQAFPREEFLAKVMEILDTVSIENTWHRTAAGIYRNWLQYLRSEKRLHPENHQAEAAANDGNHPGAQHPPDDARVTPAVLCGGYPAPRTVSTAARSTPTIL